MKKILLGTLLMFCLTSFGQEYKIEEKSITGVFDIDGKSKAQIFSAINKWISINYNSAKNVIQLNDIEAGNIIIKGINEVTYKNSMKALYPNKSYVSETTTTKFNHVIEINIKDNKFRIIYRIVDLASENYGYNDKLLDCIKLNGNNDTAILGYNNLMEVNLKKGLISKEKREAVMTLNKQMFEEERTNLCNNMKATMLSIEKSIKNAPSSDW